MTPESWQLRCAELKQRAAYLYKSKLWSDCTFQFEDVTIKAHKLIMAMASPVFSKMLYGSFVKFPLCIEDVRPEVFDLLLEYIYSDNLNINSSRDACDLYYAAKKWRLPFVAKQCVAYLNEHMSPENVCHIYQVACESGDMTLQKTCEKIFSTKTKEILEDGSFLDTNLSIVAKLFSLDPLNIDNELDLFVAAVKYANAQDKKAKKRSLSQSQDDNNNPPDGPSPRKRTRQYGEISSQNDESLEVGVCMDDLDESSSKSSQKSEETVTRDKKGKQKYRELINTIRFLSLTPQEFAECSSLSSLLADSEILALSMNIASKETMFEIPSGFSTSMVPRTQTSREDRSRLAAAFRSMIHNIRNVKKFESPPFYLRNLAWTLLVMLNKNALILGVTCFFEAGPPEWVKNTKVKIKFNTHKDVPKHLHKISLKVTDPTPEYGAWVAKVDRSDILNPEYGIIDDCNNAYYKLTINTVARPSDSPGTEDIAASEELSSSEISNLVLRVRRTPTPKIESHVARTEGMIANTPLSSRGDSVPQSLRSDASLRPTITQSLPSNSTTALKHLQSTPTIITSAIPKLQPSSSVTGPLTQARVLSDIDSSTRSRSPLAVTDQSTPSIPETRGVTLTKPSPLSVTTQMRSSPIETTTVSQVGPRSALTSQQSRPTTVTTPVVQSRPSTNVIGGVTQTKSSPMTVPTQMRSSPIETTTVSQIGLRSALTSQQSRPTTVTTPVVQSRPSTNVIGGVTQTKSSPLSVTTQMRSSPIETTTVSQAGPRSALTSQQSRPSTNVIGGVTQTKPPPMTVTTQMRSSPIEATTVPQGGSRSALTSQQSRPSTVTTTAVQSRPSTPVVVSPHQMKSFSGTGSTTAVQPLPTATIPRSMPGAQSLHSPLVSSPSLTKPLPTRPLLTGATSSKPLSTPVAQTRPSTLLTSLPTQINSSSVTGCIATQHLPVLTNSSTLLKQLPQSILGTQPSTCISGPPIQEKLSASETSAPTHSQQSPILQRRSSTPIPETIHARPIVTTSATLARPLAASVSQSRPSAPTSGSYLQTKSVSSQPSISPRSRISPLQSQMYIPRSPTQTQSSATLTSVNLRRPSSDCLPPTQSRSVAQVASTVHNRPLTGPPPSTNSLSTRSPLTETAIQTRSHGHVTNPCMMLSLSTLPRSSFSVTNSSSQSRPSQSYLTPGDLARLRQSENVIFRQLSAATSLQSSSSHEVVLASNWPIPRHAIVSRLRVSLEAINRIAAYIRQSPASRNAIMSHLQRGFFVNYRPSSTLRDAVIQRIKLVLASDSTMNVRGTSRDLPLVGVQSNPHSRIWVISAPTLQTLTPVSSSSTTRLSSITNTLPSPQNRSSTVSSVSKTVLSSAKSREAVMPLTMTRKDNMTDRSKETVTLSRQSLPATTSSQTSTPLNAVTDPCLNRNTLTTSSTTAASQISPIKLKNNSSNISSEVSNATLFESKEVEEIEDNKSCNIKNTVKNSEGARACSQPPSLSQIALPTLMEYQSFNPSTLMESSTIVDINEDTEQFNKKSERNQQNTQISKARAFRPPSLKSLAFSEFGNLFQKVGVNDSTFHEPKPLIELAFKELVKIIVAENDDLKTEDLPTCDEKMLSLDTSLEAKTSLTETDSSSAEVQSISSSNLAEVGILKDDSKFEDYNNTKNNIEQFQPLTLSKITIALVIKLLNATPVVPNENEYSKITFATSKPAHQPPSLKRLTISKFGSFLEYLNM